jgi:hypothetical protein
MFLQDNVYDAPTLSVSSIIEQNRAAFYSALGLVGLEDKSLTV